MSEEATLDEFVNGESNSDTSVKDLMTSLDETSVGRIPSDWSAVRLENLTENTLYGANESAEDYDPDKPRYIRIKDIDEQGRLKQSEKASLSADKAEGYLLEEGDMLFARSGSPGRTYLHRNNEGKYCYGGYSIKHELISEGLNHEYLSQYTKSQKYWDWIERIARTGAQANINSREYASLLVPLPSLSEQRKIATVLYTVGRAIGKTEEVIERVSRIKKGFKQDVFTEGYFDHQSHQDSQVGKIPESWKVESAANLCDGITVGVVTGATDSYVSPPEGVPFIRSQDVHENYIEQDSLKYISEEFHKQQNSSELREGDVITVRTGEPGTSCVIPPELDGANCFSLIISRPKEDVNERFYSYYVNSEKALDFIDSWKAGGVQDNFNVGVMERLPIPVPTAEEQQAIVDSLDDINERLESERQYRNHLQRLKRGLQQDLLSGTVRTTDTNIEVPDEIAQHG